MVENMSHKKMNLTSFLTLFTIASSILWNFSCNSHAKLQESVELKREVSDVINTYIDKYPHFNTLMLISTNEMNKNEHADTNYGFLLGPGYESVLKEKNYSLYFNVLGRRIFYLSEIDKLTKCNETMYLFPKNKQDSIVINDWTIKEPWVLFIHNAIFFYYDDCNKIQVSYRPDTIFVPRSIETPIDFMNENNADI